MKGAHQPDGSDVTCLPSVYVGDEAFSLRKDFLTPHNLNVFKRGRSTFSHRLLRARRVVDDIFGILTSMFDTFKTNIVLELHGMYCWLCTFDTESSHTVLVFAIKMLGCTGYRKWHCYIRTLHRLRRPLLPGEGLLRNALKKQKLSEINFLDIATTKGVCHGKISFSIENYVRSFNIS